MKFIPKDDAVHISKPEGTTVDYYLFDDYEIMYNEQAPNTTQVWHHHEHIWETLCMTSGSLVVKWRENDAEHSRTIERGTVVEMERFPHTLENISQEIARFIVIKRIPTGKNYRELFKSDKVLD